MTTHVSGPTRVPFTFFEWVKVITLPLILLSAGGFGWWTCETTTAAERVVEQLFVHLGRGEDDAAFALLAPELQQQLGSSKAIGQRWRESHLVRVEISAQCGGVVPGVSLYMNAETERPRDKPVVPFELGDIGTSSRSCKGVGPMPLVARLRGGKIYALRLDR